MNSDYVEKYTCNSEGKFWYGFHYSVSSKTCIIEFETTFINQLRSKFGLQKVSQNLTKVINQSKCRLYFQRT